MKLFTKPRPNMVALLRPGDQLAIHRVTGQVLDTEAAYIDADLSDQLRWSVVHHVDPASGKLLNVVHTLSTTDIFPPGRGVITREAIELDPWSYVTRLPDSDEVRVPEQRA